MSRPWSLATIPVICGLIWLASCSGRAGSAALLPALPDLASFPAPVRAHLEEADAAARRDPDSAATVGALGHAYHGSQADEHADAAYARAETIDPTDPRWTYLRALLAESRTRAVATVTLLTRVVQRAPDHGLAWFRLAEAELKAGRLEAAARAYERARAAPAAISDGTGGLTSRTPPLASYATTGLARVAAEQGDVAAAEALLVLLVSQRPAFGPALRLHGQMRERVDSGRPYVPPADPALDAIINESRHLDVLLKFAGIASRAGDAARREFLVRRAMSFYPDDPDVLMEMSSVLQAAGRHDEALEVLKRHERVEPGDHHGLVEQGRSLIEVGRLAEAEAVLRRAARVRDAAAHFNLGVALDRQDRWDEARQQYEQALAIDRFHARAMNNLAVGLARRGDAASARALHARALAAAPDNPEVHTNYGIALLLDGRASEAIAAFERAIVLDPASADAHNNLGVAFGQLGRLDEAAAQFREAVRLNPSHADAKRNLERLKPEP